MPMSAIFFGNNNNNNNNGNSNNGHEIMFTTQKMLYVKKSAFIFIHILQHKTNQIYFSLHERSFKIWDINGMFYDVVYEQYKKEFHSQYNTISAVVDNRTKCSVFFFNH